MSSLGITERIMFYGRKHLAEADSIDTLKSVSSERDPDKLPFLTITGTYFQQIEHLIHLKPKNNGWRT